MFSLLKAFKNLRRLQRNVDNSSQKKALRALVAMELKSYIAILALPKHKNNHTIVELKLLFLASLQQCTSIDRCELQLRAKKKKNYFAFTLLFLFFILSCFHSPFSVSLSSLPLRLFFFPPQTLLSSSQTHRRSAQAQPPQTHRPPTHAQPPT